MATTDISEYTSAILSQKKGETVRDAIINAVKVISGAVSGSRSASTLNGEPLTNFVVNYYDPNGSKPFAVSLNQTKANMKREVDKINYGDPTLAGQTELGPYSKTGVNNNHYGTHSLDRLEVTRRDIYEAINEAWRNTPSGAHGSDEYLVLDSDPFEDYPHYISLIGSGEGYALRCSERTDPITENGTYTAEEGTGWTKVTVNVSDKNIGPHTATITADGTYAASSYGKDGFSFVNVQVPTVSPDDPTYNPENPYEDRKDWYSGGTVNNKWPVLFYLDHEGGVLLDKQYVNEGEDAVFGNGGGKWADVSNPGYYFAGWNPEPTNITSRTICVAQWKKWKQVSASTGEISDSWEVIAQNHGTAYNIGDWKLLDFGTVKIPSDYYDTEAEEIVKDIASVKTNPVIMMKVAGANASNGTNSTWISINVLGFSGYNRFTQAGTGIWLMDTLQKIYDRRFGHVDQDGYYDEFELGFKDTDLYNFLNGKTNSGGSTSNNLYANISPVLLSNIKTIKLKTLGLKISGGKTDQLKEVLYVSDSFVDEANCKFWLPTTDSVIGKTSFMVDQYSIGGSEDYNDFFFNEVQGSNGDDWIYRVKSWGYNLGVYYPWLSSKYTYAVGDGFINTVRFSDFQYDSEVSNKIFMFPDENGHIKNYYNRGVLTAVVGHTTSSGTTKKYYPRSLIYKPGTTPSVVSYENTSTHKRYMWNAIKTPSGSNPILSEIGNIGFCL